MCYGPSLLKLTLAFGQKSLLKNFPSVALKFCAYVNMVPETSLVLVTDVSECFDMHVSANET